MPQAVERLGALLHLAQAAARRQRLPARDRLLYLAGAAAEELGLPEVAHACRERILRHNPGHLLRHSGSFASTLATADGAGMAAALLRRYPPERTEQLLSNLGISHSGERAAYFSDGEYAAALLGQSWDELRARYESRQRPPDD